MGDLTTLLPTLFGLQGIKATKERGYFLCKQGNEAVKIHKTTEHPQTIWTRYKLLNLVEETGFPFADKLYLSAQNAPYVLLGRETYVMSRFVAGRELALDSLEDMTLAVKTLAHFHKVKLSNVELNAPPPLLTEVFASEISLLTKTSKQIGKNVRLSDFDVMFIKNLPKYINLAEKAAEQLDKTNYANRYNTAIQQGSVCHGNLKEENFTMHNGICHITNFENATVDLQLTDLAFFLRRYAMRSQREIPLGKLLDVYDNVLPLPDSASEIIYALLIYPWQFVKLTRQYYSKKRGFIPGGIMDRTQLLLNEQEKYDAYMNTL